ncbi:MAG: PilZ domain-containing protein [Nitrospirae bacterium]|nr:PilZ domain-containing protein [Nitrospirota bacterium]
MLESKRQFRRFDLPLIVKFRPTYGPTQYSLGLTKNISCDGLCLEARDFNFIKFENLELELKFPQGNSSVSIFGEVIWKKQDGNISRAGIKLRLQDENIKNDIMEKISGNANIPIDALMFGKDIYHEAEKKKAVLKPAKKEVQSPRAFKQEIHLPVPVSQEGPVMTSGFTKEYIDDFKCRVTFRLPKAAAPECSNVTIAGDFNNWDAAVTPMSKLENGDFCVSLELDVRREYRFKYLIDGSRWENDWHADKYLPNSFGSEDSVVVV